MFPTVVHLLWRIPTFSHHLGCGFHNHDHHGPRSKPRQLYRCVCSSLQLVLGSQWLGPWRRCFKVGHRTAPCLYWVGWIKERKQRGRSRQLFLWWSSTWWSCQRCAGPRWHFQSISQPVGCRSLLGLTSGCRKELELGVLAFKQACLVGRQAPLKFDGWPWKTIGHLFYATCFNHHFVPIGEFKLELQSGNAQFGSKSCDLQTWRMTLRNNRAPLLWYIKPCASFQCHR